MSACDRYDVAFTKLPTQEAFSKIKPLDKSSDQEAISDARTWVGRLNYVATLHPALAYAANYMASALHYVPAECSRMAQQLIHAVTKFKPSFQILPVKGKYCAFYVDASQDLSTCRATAGVLIQLQDSNEPETLHNPLLWVSRRLATLYNSSYSAESKGLSEACVLLEQNHAFITRMWPGVQFIMFTDNQALCKSIEGANNPHPFASSIIDFVKQQ